ncbi:hypothetical protein D0X99_14300 [Algoriphagus lacus]|uniref:Uncharacterized protein n=1 Tax=Algoriphagus lacus TaxID=2056311 RepID=A0A418PPH8_9BACT|nr:hypothetical protein D0X99_14300 [Algoriphagus lacus]
MKSLDFRVERSNAKVPTLLDKGIELRVDQVNKRKLSVGSQVLSTEGHICSTNAEKAIFTSKIKRKLN